MKAISLMQPWAGLLVLGIKGFETRSWNTKHRGPLAIHASAKLSTEGWMLLDYLKANHKGFELNGEWWKVCTQRGSVIGTVDLISTHETACTTPYSDLQKWNLERKLGDWTPGRWAWNCENPILFEKPVPAKGKLQLWEWDGNN